MNIRTLTSLFVLGTALFTTASYADNTSPNTPSTTEQPDKTANKAEGEIEVVLETTAGNIKLELDANKAPITVNNFVKHVQSGHYDGTIFHRVIDNFMIQGGGFTANMSKKSISGTIKNEADNGLKNVRGSIAMARRNAPHSAQAQFFINVKNNPNLDHTGKTPYGWGYAVFGRVIEGMDVVDAIRKTPTTTVRGYRDVPTKPIIIKKAYTH